MRTLAATLVLLFVLVGAAGAQMGKILLDNPETVDPPQAVRINWEKIVIEKGKLVVYYQEVDSTGAPIRRAGTFRSDHTWTCENVPTPGENASCVGAGDPFPCCTGAGTGTCDGFDSTCFSQIFGYDIACPADNGAKLGIRLRNLLFSAFRQDRLSPGNDGTFEP